MKKLKEKVRLFLNRAQAKIFQSAQKTITSIVGRGGGKTTLIGDIINRNFKAMPRSKGFLLLKTFGQAYTKSWPEIADRLEKYGLKEHEGPNDPGHYVVCVKPPKWYQKPFKKPKKHDNCITFINGMMIDILSFDRPDLNRGGSYDWGIVDEGALISYDQFTKTIRPLLRGNVKDWNHPLRFTLWIFTSRAWKASGKWTETIMKQLAAQHPDLYAYFEASARDNIAVLGEQYFDRMKLELDAMTYAVEIENEPIKKLPNAYYPDLDDERHLYDPEFDYEYSEDTGYKIKSERDVDPEITLEVSFDFNSYFNSCTIWQDHRPEKNELRCVMAFFIKHPNVEDLVDLVCDHYADREDKTINIFGGKDGLSKYVQYSDFTLYQRIEFAFRKRGWTPVNMVEISLADVAHKQKFLVLSNVLREGNPDIPKVRMNEQTCKKVYLSMVMSPILPDFTKDKRSEKDENVDQEDATHLGDTFDNYVYPKVLTDYQQETDDNKEEMDFSTFTY